MSKPQREQNTRWDQYYTPRWPIQILCDFLNQPEGTRVYEPCAGEGGIVDPLEDNGFEVIGADLAPNTPYAPIDFVSEETSEYVSVGEHAAWADWIITNPPYQSRGYKAEDFVERAINMSNQVAMLLRQSFQEPTQGREKDRKGRQWLFEHYPPDYQLVLPRVHYGGPDGEDEDGKSDNSETSIWMIWLNGGTDRGDCRTRWYTHDDKELAKGQQFMDI